ncbi:MAG: NADPH:quinone reductase [Vicinamibacterales bacterium]
MRSIVVREFGAPGVLQVETVPDLTPAAGQVLVRVRAVGVNPVDTYIRSGNYAMKPPLPYTPGNDGAGEVLAVGSEVKGLSVGDRVYIAGDNTPAPRTGLCAEQALVSPSHLHRLPANVSFGQGAAIGVPYATAYQALFHRAKARPAETVLVHGASGGVGIAACEFARAHGMFVVGSASTEQGRAIAREHGAHVVVDHSDATYIDQIMQATGGRGVDVILEMAAHLNLDKDFGMLGRFGRVVIIGSRGRIEIDPRGVMGRDGAVLGMLLFNVSPADLAATHAAIVAGLDNGTLRPVVAQEFTLDKAADAHEAVMKPGALGKIVIAP